MGKIGELFVVHFDNPMNRDYVFAENPWTLMELFFCFRPMEAWYGAEEISSFFVIPFGCKYEFYP